MDALDPNHTNTEVVVTTTTTTTPAVASSMENNSITETIDSSATLVAEEDVSQNESEAKLQSDDESAPPASTPSDNIQIDNLEINDAPSSITNSSIATTDDPIISIMQRLLALRGSPPGTQASISEAEIKLLTTRVRPILLSQPMLLELEAPLKICGDVHGQYLDLLRLFEYGGFPPQTNYLFLGDYVDRGKQSLEVICLLLCYKIQYPNNFFILRGNHEAAGINRIYGFYDECKRRYSIKLWKQFSELFNCLPVSALIDEKILCMHGGLSPEIESLQQIADLSRPCDIPDVGLMCDLLWSDPDHTINGWGENDRGVSFVFGADVVCNFLEKHDLDLVVRAHQVVEDGYEFFAGRRLVTLFSAPNYCGEFDNAGGIISVDENLCCSFMIIKPSSRSERFAQRSMSGQNISLSSQPQLSNKF